MKHCDTIQPLLPGYLAGELWPEEKIGVERHLRSCDGCRQALEEYKQIDAGLESAEEVPLALREQILQRIQKELLEEQQASGRETWRSIGKVAAAMGIGIVQVLLFGYLSGTFVPNMTIPPAGMVLACVLWCGLIMLAAMLVFDDYRLEGLRLRWIAAGALGGVALASLGPFLISTDPLYFLWQTTMLGRELAEHMGAGASTFLFGLLYGLVPMSLMAFWTGKRMTGSIIKNGVFSGILFCILILPAIYLQSFMLFIHSTTVLLSWAMGSCMGALGGIYSGMGFYRISTNRWKPGLKS